MKHYDITKPIGLATPCKEIESTCSNAHMYKRCGLRPKHYIIPLDSGSGRTTLVEYMTDKYKEAGVLSFTSGLDDYIEIAFDGSLQQLKQAFAAIDSAAVYTNEYCNIIGMDISGISAHLGETQLSEFMKNCKRVCEDISALIIKTVEEHGIEIKHENVFRAVLADMVSEFCIASVKDAITTADALVHFADFSGFIPTVDEGSLKSMITSWHNDAERSEVK